MFFGGFETPRKRRPHRLRLRAKKPQEGVAVLAARAVECAPELLPHLPCALLADTREKADEAEEGKFVGGIDEKPQIREDVLYMQLLEKADSARYPERDPHAGHGGLDVDGMEVAPVENGHVAVAVAALAHHHDGADDLPRLRIRVVDPRKHRQGAKRVAHRTKRLLELARGVAHDYVRNIENRGHRPVVPLQLHYLTSRPTLRKLHYVLYLRAAPCVDALEVVADGHYVAALAGENVGEVRLQAVRILVFVDEDVDEMLLQSLAYAVVFVEEPEPVHEEVVEVHRAELLLAGDVEIGDLCYGLRLHARRLRLPARRDEPDGPAFVRGLRYHLGDKFLLREVLWIGHIGLYDLAYEPPLVLFVEYLEPRAIAERASVAAEETRADGVERSGPDGGHGVARKLLRPFKHFPRGAVGERQEEYPPCGNAALHEIGDAVDEGSRLAGPGGGEDEKRPVVGRSGGKLFRIEKSCKISHGSFLFSFLRFHPYDHPLLYVPSVYRRSRDHLVADGVVCVGGVPLCAGDLEGRLLLGYHSLLHISNAL